MNQRLRQVLQVLLHVEDTPHRTALAFGVGVLIAFSPFLGVHFGIALAVAFLFRLNRVAILFGTYLNNPWTIAPIYLAGTSLGCLLLGVSHDGLEAIDWELTGAAFRREPVGHAAPVPVAVHRGQHAARRRLRPRRLCPAAPLPGATRRRPAAAGLGA